MVQHETPVPPPERIEEEVTEESNQTHEMIRMLSRYSLAQTMTILEDMTPESLEEIRSEISEMETDAMPDSAISNLIEVQDYIQERMVHDRADARVLSLAH